MGEATDRLRIKLARIQVKPHTRRIRSGARVPVAGYFREGRSTGRDPAWKSPTPPSAGLGDAEFEAHAARTRETVERAIAAGHDTASRHAVDLEAGIWSPERVKLHAKIAKEIYERDFGNVPSGGRAMFSGGLGGAGKTTVLQSGLVPDFDPKDYGTVNPDDIKEDLIRRGLAPEIEGLSPLETAPLIHEESSAIAKMVAHLAYRAKKNIIWDITMNNERSVYGRIKELRDRGYDDIRAVFVDIPVEVSIRRATARYRRGLEDWKARRPGALGGRYVPPDHIRRQAHQTKSSKNRAVFDSFRREFDSYVVVDNSRDGEPPRLIESGP